MPAPSRTSVERIVAAGRSVLSDAGMEGLTMQRVASEVGVRPPSLYKHVANRADLVRLVVADIARETRELLAAAAGEGDAADDARAMALALRGFAHRDRHAFEAMFSPAADAATIDSAVYATAAEPILEVAARLAGADHALDAARTVTAWAAGFLTMELAGAFHLGGDLDRAYDYGIDALIAALRKPQ
ncbi:WHG domain-containing protein [Demequina sp. SYSU T00039]|uniref:WHG domain-containing protein n=1 Tax=Demequina lignilytica TaxID=3051663 RepID=A0AAW7M3A5_9MICO|nr:MULTISPECIES: TetR/AcrR family transcriptional regulator [unclassified Demequina]MDN4477382.1 WHG domain-containing protein [Demequina sp. SYSU T00039-1]MDN4487555.1 WHG domain-containing protein [Demequina sp. SYSU T00039]